MWLPLLFSLLLYTLPVFSLLPHPCLPSHRGLSYPSAICAYSNMEIDENSLVSQVKRALYDSPFMEARSLVEDDVIYSSPLLSFEGFRDYVELSEGWNKQLMPSLYCSKFCVMKVAALNEKSVIVNWNVTFVSENTAAIVAVFNVVPFVRIRYFDILNRERIRSSFSWEALGKTLLRLLETGELLLPHAVIVGSSEMTFKKQNIKSEDSISLVAQKDSLNLIKSLDAGYLKNRKLTLDLLEFCDKMRPSYMDFDKWNDVMTERIDTRKVPGMGQFDIDGLEGTNEENIQTVSNTFLKLSLPLGLITVIFSGYLWNQILFSSDIGAANMQPLDYYYN